MTHCACFLRLAHAAAMRRDSGCGRASSWVTPRSTQLVCERPYIHDCILVHISSTYIVNHRRCSRSFIQHLHSRRPSLIDISRLRTSQYVALKRLVHQAMRSHLPRLAAHACPRSASGADGGDTRGAQTRAWRRLDASASSKTFPAKDVS